MVKLAINGLGRIGRAALRIAAEQPNVDVVAVNDVAPTENLAYLLRHDSVYSPPHAPVSADGDTLHWGDRRIPCLHESQPAKLPWRDLEAEVVIEATGLFRSREDAAQHLDAGAQRVLITAPGKGVDLTVCVGINHHDYDRARHAIISNASCTTNCLAPIAKVLHTSFGIETGFLTTVHAVTGGQSLVDQPHKKMRRGRSALVNIVPTSTGAAEATAEVLPELAGRMNGLAMRVPVVDGSVVDLVVRTERACDAEAVNQAFRDAAEGGLKGILGVGEEPLVSSDVIGCGYSSLADLSNTMVLGDRTVKVLAWYDNEWAYAQRVVELAGHVAANA